MAAPPLTSVFVRCPDGQTRQLLCEPTSNDSLFLGPTIAPGGRYSGHWEIVHQPTGRRLASTYLTRPDQLRKVVDKVADLDWTPATVAEYATTGHGKRLAAAIRQVEMADPPRFGGDRPDTAVALIGHLLDQLNHQPAEPIPASDPRWPLYVIARVSAYGMVWCLAALKRVDPAAADSAAARLAAAWEAGDGIGEWSWQWAQELGAGEPLTLYGIPSPSPGAVFAATADDPVPVSAAAAAARTPFAYQAWHCVACEEEGVGSGSIVEALDADEASMYCEQCGNCYDQHGRHLPDPDDQPEADPDA
jgi:hypothetical protein